MVDSVQLILFEEAWEVIGQFGACIEVAAERLLHDDATPAPSVTKQSKSFVYYYDINSSDSA